MKKFLFFSCLLFVSFNFGSGSVREQFNADRREREKLIADPKGSIVARLIKLLKKN